MSYKTEITKYWVKEMMGPSEIRMVVEGVGHFDYDKETVTLYTKIININIVVVMLSK